MTTSNHLTGQVAGHAVQAGAVHGDIVVRPAPLPLPLPRQLPPVPASFTDREHVLGAMRARLAGLPPESVHIAAISGPGGVGKSTLACRLLHTVASKYPGGQLYVHARSHHPDSPAGDAELLEALTRSLRPEPLPGTLSELVALWRSVTAARPPTALLIDDAVRADQVRLLLPGGSGHLVVVTSREPLMDLVPTGALLHPLAPLDEAAGTQLLARLIGEERVTTASVAARALVRASGGLPLALGLWAAPLAADPDQQLPSALSALSVSPPRPAGAAMNALTRAYERLDDDADRHVYRQLGCLFTIDLDLPTTAAACGLTEAAAHEHQTTLARAALLTTAEEDPVRGPLWQMHDTTRRHARGLADTGEQQTVQRRALEWLVTVTRAAERLLTPHHQRLECSLPPQQVGLPFSDESGAEAWLEAQHPNLMAGLRAAYKAGLDQLTCVLNSSMWPWWHRGHHYSLWIEAHTLAIAAARRSGNVAAELQATNTRGVGYRNSGRTDEALAAFDQVLTLARENGEDFYLAQAHHELGATHRQTGNDTTAHSHFTRAHQLREGLGLPRGAALSLHGLAEIHVARGELSEAIDAFSRVHDQLLALDPPERFDAARAQAWLGRVLFTYGQPGRGHGALEQARDVFTSGGTRSRRWEARCTEWLGEGAQKQGDYTEAADCYARALEIYRELGRRGDIDRLDERQRSLSCP
ncbi:tetratricopeptide repeat protein [Streptomyces sp. NPDC054796]